MITNHSDMIYMLPSPAACRRRADPTTLYTTLSWAFDHCANRHEASLDTYLYISCKSVHYPSRLTSARTIMSSSCHIRAFVSACLRHHVPWHAQHTSYTSAVWLHSKFRPQTERSACLVVRIGKHQIARCIILYLAIYRSVVWYVRFAEHI